MSDPNAIPPLPFSAKARRTHEAPISHLMAMALVNPDLVNLAAGFVDDVTLPVEQCRGIAQKIFSDRLRGQSALQYNTTLGLKPLREVLLRHIERLEGKPAGELGLSAEQILITTGSQQALYLIADVLLDPGDIVITGNPSYFVFAGVLESLGAHVMGVPVDEQGMDVDAVERLLMRLAQQGRTAKFIYVTSFFENPTGLTLSLPRRKRLVEVARRFSTSQRLLILEDAAYRELRFEGEGLPSVKSFDPDNQYTILTQTFSKPFAPGLKLGYTAMPGELLDAALVQKGNHDFGSSSIAQHIALEAMTDGSYAAHVELLNREYRRKRDAMLGALDKHLGGKPGVRWMRPQGGMYVWLTLPAHMDASGQSKLFKACLRRGVLYVPGEYCFQRDEAGHVPKNHIRLSFGQVRFEQIEEGVARLAGAIGELEGRP